MRGLTYFTIATFALATSVTAIPQKKYYNGAGASAASAAVGAVAATSTPAPVTSTVAIDAAVASNSVTRGAQTKVIFEVNNVPGNEYLTFP